MSGSLNGKTGEMLRWIVALVIAGVIGYYSSLVATTERLRAVEVLQDAQYAELLRAVTDVKQEVRDLRAELAKRR